MSRIPRSVYRGMRLRAPLIRGESVDIGYQVVLDMHAFLKLLMENLSYAFTKGSHNSMFRSISCTEVTKKNKRKVISKTVVNPLMEH